MLSQSGETFPETLEEPMKTQLILASASPRRRELMKLTGIDYIVDAPEVDETCDLPAREAVLELCTRKARAAAQLHPGCIVLAADTLVSVDDQPLGKPQDDVAVRAAQALRCRDLVCNVNQRTTAFLPGLRFVIMASLYASAQASIRVASASSVDAKPKPPLFPILRRTVLVAESSRAGCP